MATYFISRHPGAIAWCTQQGIQIDAVIAHLDPALINAGDCVIGTLPLHLAAEVQQRGARYLHLSLEVPAQWRGLELSLEQMQDCHVKLQEYSIHALAKAY